MSELRWNPICREWTVTATHRMDRTLLPPREYCPLCPTKKGGFTTEIPRENFEIVVFENRFPSFKIPPPKIEAESIDLHPVKESRGVCEVVVYSPEHHGSMATLSHEQIVNLIRVWRDRYEELGRKKEIEYVLIFENKGEEVGVTLHHPHGQIYAFPYLPPIPERELSSARDYRKKNDGKCLFCDVLRIEESEGSRVVASNKDFTAFLPFYARYPFEVHIYSRHHRSSLSDLTAEEDQNLASILQKVVRGYDALFETSFPYLMILHQDPVKGKRGLNHLHFEFLPPVRDMGKLKFLAGCEQGAGTFINDSIPEEKAMQLRRKIPQN
ncbi:MAG: galactose-1-phosphate uridylyltransferase [Firmicutes bacterium]|nr:galactose-1-phosphate uridylyltransferase [Bacillota bacterium]